MSVNQAHPLDSVEAAPPLPPLCEAMTEEQHDEILSEEQRRVGRVGQEEWEKGGRRATQGGSRDRGRGGEGQAQLKAGSWAPS